MAGEKTLQPEITSVSGCVIQWNPDGTCTFDGLPVTMMWIDTTLMGLMSGLQAMVGAQRFGLALQSEGRKSVAADWQVISRCADFREGFRTIAHIAAVAGWGRWQLESMDSESRTCRFRAANSWEGRYQQTLGRCWGSGMLAGKFAGYCSRLFDTNCWADQTAWIARGDPHDEFFVHPSDRSVEREIQDLLASDEATRADMAVALRTLQSEIAERRQAERAAVESERRFRELADSLPETVFETDATGRLTFVNRTAFQEFGYTEADFSGGLHAFQMIAPEDRDRAAENFRERMQDGLDHSQEYMSLRKDGSTFPVILLSSPILRDGRPVGLRGILVDITERRRAEQEHLRTQRLRAVGELAAGVSHNLNNILTGILGPADLLRARCDRPEFMRELDIIVASAQRAADLVEHLYLSVAGRDEALRQVAVNRVIREAVRAARPRWRDEPQSRGIAVEVVADLGDVPDVAATQSGLHDILLNFIFNAVDALPAGGVITVATRQRDGGMELTVSDTGVGMEEETLTRVFEPFFTTKSEIGTGLGLATVYSTVTGWDGTIDVDSTPGGGTTFTVWLPSWQEEGTPPQEEVDPLVHRARIAIVEDDDTVREVLGQLLSTEHDVEAYESGPLAIEAFGSKRFDVALIDLGLAELPGDQVAERLRAFDPHLATILITGWRLHEEDSRLRLFDFHLRKPFARLQEIRTAVARAVELRDRRAGQG